MNYDIKKVGLPQSLRALSRFNVTESTTDEELLAKLKQ